MICGGYREKLCLPNMADREHNQQWDKGSFYSLSFVVKDRFKGTTYDKGEVFYAVK